MPDYLSCDELAALLPGQQAATYQLKCRFEPIGADDTPRYHISQARLYAVADRRPDGSYSRVLGVVSRHCAGRYRVTVGGRLQGEIEGGWFTYAQGERFRLIKVQG